MGIGGDGSRAAIVAVLTSVTDFDEHLRANNALNIRDSMGTFSYIANSDFMACAQTRSCGWSSLKCRLDVQ